MKVRDNRNNSELAKGKIVSIYRWGDGITVTLDTGYDIIIERPEIESMLEPKEVGNNK